MPSASLKKWRDDRRPSLDEVEKQYVASAESSPTSRLAEENVRGYTLLLAAHFQGYCRDLYTECTQIITAAVAPSLQLVIQRQFEAGCALKRGNANLDNIKSDFNRFGLSLDLSAMDPSNPSRLKHLRSLNEWRNIAAHHGVVPPSGLPVSETLADWRDSCEGLAISLDDVMYNRLGEILGVEPWTP